jgi:hypothetical protein
MAKLTENKLALKYLLLLMKNYGAVVLEQNTKPKKLAT